MNIGAQLISVIAVAIVVGVIVANSSNFNQIITGAGTFSSGITNKLIGITPMSGGS